MLDQIELVFSWLKAFNLKIKLKKCYFFQACVIFLYHVLSADGISANPEKVDKVQDWPSFGILLLLVYTKFSTHSQMFTPVSRSNQCQEDKRERKEVTSLDDKNWM